MWFLIKAEILNSPQFSAFLSKVIVVGLLLLTAFEIRGNKVNMENLSFYWTTARAGLLLFCLATLPWFCMNGLREVWHQYRSLFISSIAFLLVAFISIIVNKNKGAEFERLYFYCCFFYVFWFFLWFSSPDIVNFLPSCLLTLGIVLSFLGIIEHCSSLVEIFLSSTFHPMTDTAFRGRSLASLQNPTTYGAMLATSYLCGNTIRKFRKWHVFFPISAVFFVAIAFSQSRLAIGLFLVVLCFNVYFFYLRQANGNRKKLLLGGLGLLAIMLSMLAIPRMRQSFRETLSISMLSIRATDALLSYRLSFWKAAYGMWRDNKIMGVGVGNYGTLLVEYGTIFGSDTQYQHPHNLLVRIMCEMGIIGILAFLIFAYFMGEKTFCNGISIASWPFLLFLLFEMFDELTRDAFPSLMLVLVTVYAIKLAQTSPRTPSTL